MPKPTYTPVPTNQFVHADWNNQRIIIGPISLPENMTVAGKSWKLKDKTIAQLAEMQWYPFIYTNTPPIVPYETYTSISLKWRNGQVEATFVKQQVSLETAKSFRRDEINSRREELLGAGIIFQGHTLSMHYPRLMQ